MSLADLLHHRRAVRDYLPTPIDSDIVTDCLRLATLAPTSSNMQLYEFYHITNKATLATLAKACLSQSAATTAQEMVVFVIRPDLHRKHAQMVFEFEKQNIKSYSPAEKVAARIKKFDHYYNRLMPLLYAQNVPLISTARKTLACGIQKFRPIQADVSTNDIKIVMHKSCGLVAQTFMLAMSEQGLDTCPMEGFDGEMIKTLLRLPKDSEVNMVISCGIRSEKGVWGERYRVPFDEVYHKV
ncbi:nitroreductase family protein [Moraxella nasovis]|uniref:nitroreductase family protein n=1 Tax=Moraxella nasovis TaxID=2904121 RepID=UPI001F625DD6|nr:nitroreductase family protein [Moraxella nasovis]UNU73202.1 nitroreductase family protein [Moraxella nasovis]